MSRVSRKSSKDSGTSSVCARIWRVDSGTASELRPVTSSTGTSRMCRSGYTSSSMRRRRSCTAAARKPNPTEHRESAQMKDDSIVKRMGKLIEEEHHLYERGEVHEKDRARAKSIEV